MKPTRARSRLTRTFRALPAALLLAGAGLLFTAGEALGDGAAQISTSKSIPEATVAVIDPESGTSTGGASTDINIAVGDIILFRLNYTSIPDFAVHGIQGWLTDYIPDNTEVVGVRIIDEDGLTIPVRYPGQAPDDCGAACNQFNAVPCSTGTCNLEDGSIAQVYADTGFFFATDMRLLRHPADTFITMQNGIWLDPTPSNIGRISLLLEATAPYHAHNEWDFLQVRAFGTASSACGNRGTGNTPYLYGSPVAGPDTFYGLVGSPGAAGAACTTHQDCGDQEVCDAGTCYQIEFNGDTGPWERVFYPGAQIGTGSAATGTASPPTRAVTDTLAGWDVTPNNPLPAGTTAVRLAAGEVRVGEAAAIEIALRVLGAPLDTAQNENVNCSEVIGGEQAGSMAKDNPWTFFLPSPVCVYLRLLFDLSVDKLLAVTGDTLTYTLHGKNLSLNPETNVVVKQKFPGARIAYVAGSATGGGTLVQNCDGDGLDCIVWPTMDLQPSQEYTFTSQFTVGGGGHRITPAHATYVSDQLPAPGFTTQALTVVKAITVVDATLVSDTPNAAPGGTASLSGSLINRGNSDGTYETLTIVLPSGWTLVPGTVLVDGAAVTCTGTDTNTPTCTVNTTVAAGTAVPLSFEVNVPAGETTGLYPIDLSVMASQAAFGSDFETYFRAIVEQPVGEPRAAIPQVDCPIDVSAIEITGTSSEPDGTMITIYFNHVPRGTAVVSGGTWSFSQSDWLASFGELYIGLEVRATADGAGTLESELSEACFVGHSFACSDGVDNDGDGLIDFPADPGCDSPSDGSEEDPPPPECSDGVDNDGNGLVDYPDDPSCSSPYDDTEDGVPACSDGVDNDGDGLVDYPDDPGCESANDPDEISYAACQDGLDNDGDGFVDFPEDPGCHSRFDDDETDFVFPLEPVKPRILIVFDTSGSMNWNTCASVFTGGDGSAYCPGQDVSCLECDSSSCNNGLPDDSRIYKVKVGIHDAVTAYGSVDWGLMRFQQRAVPFACPGTNASLSSGGWQGAGAEPCGGGFNAGELLVGFSPENALDLLAWMDLDSNYPGDPPPGMDRELRGTGTTPLAGSLYSAGQYIDEVRTLDPAAACRPYRVILVTDGLESCGGDPVAAAGTLDGSNIPVHVIGFATTDTAITGSLDAIAAAGGTAAAAIADDEVSLSTTIGAIISDSILVELCNGLDDDCDTLIDEDFPDLGHPCDNGQMGECYREGVIVCRADGLGTECDAETVLPPEDPEVTCDGLDNDCDCIGDTNGDGCVCCAGDYNVDEGLLNACGTCGALPEEICDWLDNDCNGIIDDVPGGGDPCVHPDAPGPVGDEGECELGAMQCVSVGLFECVGAVGPEPERCDCLDNDCDGQTDEEPEPGEPALCPEGSECIDCWCVTPCEPGEFACPSGYYCDSATGTCFPSECTRAQCPPGTYCALDQFCQGADCTGACAGVCGEDEYCKLDDQSCHVKPCLDLCALCEPDQVCVDGVCLDDTCYNFPERCAEGEICLDATCISNPCQDVECGDNQFCREGECFDSCAFVYCFGDEMCVDGKCVPDPCAGLDCEAAGQVCDGVGACVSDPCFGVDCGPGRICQDGECVDDHCGYIACPQGSVCAEGECVAPAERTWVKDTGCGCASSGDQGSVPAWPLWMLLIVVGVVVRRRPFRLSRRPRGASLLAAGALAASALALGGCETTWKCTDCTECVPTNDGTEICDGVDNDCDCPGDTNGDGYYCATGDEGVDEDFDLDTDVENCGECGNRCDLPNAVSICVGGVCRVDHCLPGYYDGDDNPANGCEYPCVPTNDGTEICDGRDNDCDCIGDTNGDGCFCCQGDEGVDEPEDLEGVNLSCGSDEGTCQQGLTSCVDGAIVCEGKIGPEEEICDGLDNNCNGQVDETFYSIGLGQPCYAGLGVCRLEGEFTCDASGTGVWCGCTTVIGGGVCDALGDEMPETGDIGQSGAEVCNGLDNDCNGVVDDGAPNAMVHVTSGELDFWIDVYEASRPDATAMGGGIMTHRSCSEPGAMPWYGLSWSEAQVACEAAGYRLCTEQEWQAACEGPLALAYPYGETYDASACNGGDYDHDCSYPDDDVVLPTGTAYGCPAPTDTRCISDHGAIDLSGNLMEWTGTQVGDAPITYRIRGGSHENLAAALTCQFSFISAEPEFRYGDLGFRCCSDASP